MITRSTRRESRYLVTRGKWLSPENLESLRIRIVQKSELSDEQNKYLNERLALPKHSQDKGPPNIWDSSWHYLYAFICKESELPIAIAEASGRPEVSPGWWIDRDYRGQGYGNELVDLLADFVIRDGATTFSAIPIDTFRGEYNEASRKLACRFKEYFE